MTEKVIYVDGGSNAIAGVASFFVPGLGQLIQGRLLSAIFFFGTCFALGVLTVATAGFGFILYAPVWLWAIWNAARYRRRR